MTPRLQKKTENQKHSHLCSIQCPTITNLKEDPKNVRAIVSRQLTQLQDHNWPCHLPFITHAQKNSVSLQSVIYSRGVCLLQPTPTQNYSHNSETVQQNAVSLPIPLLSAYIYSSLSLVWLKPSFYGIQCKWLHLLPSRLWSMSIKPIYCTPTFFHSDIRS